MDGATTTTCTGESSKGRGRRSRSRYATRKSRSAAVPLGVVSLGRTYRLNWNRPGSWLAQCQEYELPTRLRIVPEVSLAYVRLAGKVTLSQTSPVDPLPQL